MNIGAFRNIFVSSVDRIDRLERTPKGRRQLIAKYRAEAKRLRESSGLDLWRDAVITNAAKIERFLLTGATRRSPEKRKTKKK